jgi:O-antigen ligase
VLLALFVLLTAALLLRPADFVPVLRGLGLYYAILGLTWLAALPRLTNRDTLRRLTAHPVTWCVLGLQVVVVLSHLTNGRIYEARVSGITFLEVPLYYLLLLVVCDTPRQLERFLGWLVVLIAVQTVIAVLQFYNVIELPAVATLLQDQDFDPATGEFIVIPRLTGLGLFHDPNELCLLLAMGIGIAAWELTEGALGPGRLLGLGLLLFFGFGVVLTQSRGGLVGVLIGVGTYVWLRWGWRKAIIGALVGLPVIFATLGGRIARVSTEEGTAQQRIELWRDALQFFKQAPVFGIGMDQFVEEVGLVTHNSFLHCYAELGFLGGTLFLAAFVLTLWPLYQVANAPSKADDPRVPGLAAFLFAIIAGYAGGAMSVSRSYVIPTYLVLGLGVVLAQLAAPIGETEEVRITSRRVMAVGALSVGFIALMYLFVRLAVAGPV